MILNVLEYICIRPNIGYTYGYVQTCAHHKNFENKCNVRTHVQYSMESVPK